MTKRVKISAKDFLSKIEDGQLKELGNYDVSGNVPFKKIKGIKIYNTHFFDDFDGEESHDCEFDEVSFWGKKSSFGLGLTLKGCLIENGFFRLGNGGEKLGVYDSYVRDMSMSLHDYRFECNHLISINASSKISEGTIQKISITIQNLNGKNLKISGGFSYNSSTYCSLSLMDFDLDGLFFRDLEGNGDISVYGCPSYFIDIKSPKGKQRIFIKKSPLDFPSNPNSRDERIEKYKKYAFDYKPDKAHDINKTNRLLVVDLGQHEAIVEDIKIEKEFKIYKFDNESSILLDRIIFGENCCFKAEKSEFASIKIFNTDLRNVTVLFRYCNLEYGNFIGVKWPLNIHTNERILLDGKGTRMYVSQAPLIRDIYRQLKFNYVRRNDTHMALGFYMREMTVLRKEISPFPLILSGWLKKMSPSYWGIVLIPPDKIPVFFVKAKKLFAWFFSFLFMLFDWISLWVSKITSNHGTNWGLAVFWLLTVAYLNFCHDTYWNGQWEFCSFTKMLPCFKKDVLDSLKYIDITRKVDKDVGGATVLFKIAITFSIYQVVVSFRKFNRKF